MTMRFSPSRRSTLLSCGLLMVLVAVPCVLTWREWRQEKIDRELISALHTHNVPSALALLNAGADPNSCTPPVSSLVFLPLLRKMLRQPLQAEATPSPPLLLAVEVPLNADMGDHVGFDEAENKHTEEATRMVAALLDKGARVNVEDAKGRTPLMWAASTGRTAITRRIQRVTLICR